MNAIEAMITRAVTVAVKELARDLLPDWLAKRVSPPVDKPVHVCADKARVARVAHLIEAWEAYHADWCCTRGCTWPNAEHIEGAVDDIIRGTAGSTPCSGACTCETDNYVVPLREAIA